MHRTQHTYCVCKILSLLEIGCFKTEVEYQWGRLYERDLILLQAEKRCVCTRKLFS